MNPRRIAAIVRRHAYETRRNPDRIADVMFWPMLDVVTWGVFSRYLAQGSHLRLASPPLLVGAIVLWGAFRAFQRDIAVGFLAEIWSRNIVGLFASPLGFAEYLTAVLAIDLAKLALALGVVIALVAVVSGAPVWDDIARLAPSLMILLMFGAATGIFVTGLIFRFTTRVQTLAYGVAGVLMPISCVFYPLSALPPPLRALAWALPTTHAFEAMRAAMTGKGAAAAHLAWGFGLAAIALAGAAIFFSRVVGAARRSGHLVRLD